MVGAGRRHCASDTSPAANGGVAPGAAAGDGRGLPTGGQDELDAAVGSWCDKDVDDPEAVLVLMGGDQGEAEAVVQERLRSVPQALCGHLDLAAIVVMAALGCGHGWPPGSDWSLCLPGHGVPAIRLAACSSWSTGHATMPNAASATRPRTSGVVEPVADTARVWVVPDPRIMGVSWAVMATKTITNIVRARAITQARPSADAARARPSSLTKRLNGGRPRSARNPTPKVAASTGRRANSPRTPAIWEVPSKSST